jgi:hypothetical protein
MSTTASKSIRVIEFSGKRSDYHMWAAKILAAGARKGYDKIWDGRVLIPSQRTYALASATAEADRTLDEKAAIVSYNLNCEAFSELLLSISGVTSSGKVAFAEVDGSRTVENPDGDARQAWSRLVSKYAPQNAPSFVKMEMDYVNSKLAEGKNPDIWITRLEYLRTEMNKVVLPGKSMKSETDLILHVLANVPEAYETQVNEIESALTTGITSVTLAYVRSKFLERYERIRMHSGKDADDEKALQASFGSHFPDHEAVASQYLSSLSETALLSYMKQFKGTCNSCGKYGHKGTDCPDRKKPRTPGTDMKGILKTGSRFKGLCHFCGVAGHRKVECYKYLQGQAEKANFANIEVEDDDSESDMWENHGDYDELGLLCRVSLCQLSEPDQPEVRKSKKRQASPCAAGRVSFCDEAAVMSFTERQLGVVRYQPVEFSPKLRPKKRVKMEENDQNDSMVGFADESDLGQVNFSGDVLWQVNPVDEMCLVASTLASAGPKRARRDKSCVIGDVRYPAFTHTTTVGDSGASCHLCTNNTGMYDVEEIQERIGGIEGTAIFATLKGKLGCTVKQADGTTTPIVLDVKYCKNAAQQLFSITYEMNRGAVLGQNERKDITLTYPDGKVLAFDRRERTRDGWVAGVDLHATAIPSEN